MSFFVRHYKYLRDENDPIQYMNFRSMRKQCGLYPFLKFLGQLQLPNIFCEIFRIFWNAIDSYYFLCHTLSHQHRCWQRAIHRCHYSGQSYLIIRSIAFAWITDKLE